MKQEISFTWDEYFWITKVTLPTWRGFLAADGPYASFTGGTNESGEVNIIYAPEGRGDEPLSEEEKLLIEWVVVNQNAIHDAMLKAIYKEYPKLKENYREYGFNESALKTLFPDVGSPSDIKKTVGVSNLFVHNILSKGEPFIGVELGCPWDEEHGLGVLLHGSKVLEVGQADTAMTLWMAKRYIGDA
jgi:hypothetical protein